MDDPRLRRTMLMTPGNRPDRMRKAAGLAADCVVFDLEDSIPPDQKYAARACLAEVLRELPDTGPERCVRINAWSGGCAIDDLRGLPLGNVDTIMLPKVESADELHGIEQLLIELGADRDREAPLELIVTLETPRGVLSALSIADASRRTSALFFGSGDYTSAVGAALTDTALQFARSTIVAAAGAAGIQAIDAAFFERLRDVEATRRDAQVARDLGFQGKVVFHPDQIGVVNQVFSPSAAEIDRAEHVVATYRDALADGHGTALSNGVFVAIDLVAPAERLLQKALAIQALGNLPTLRQPKVAKS
jgi:citrate lyase subunit beta/citryl-CoA lyase